MPPRGRNSLIRAGWVLGKVQDFALLQSFDCCDSDLNDFFRRDALPHKNQLLAEVYSLTDASDNSCPPILVGLATFHNDAIKLSKDQKKGLLPPEKHYEFHPAVKIGRLGVAIPFQGNGIGTHLLNMAKQFFLEDNRTGCRFITVDAYNKPRVLNFYQKNDFQFLHEKDANRRTRIMYFDLLRLSAIPALG